MGRADFYKPGEANKICDRTGMKQKSSWTHEEWNRLIVRARSWEPRHPQDKLRAIPDHQAVPDPRPEGADSFVDLTEDASSALLDGDELIEPDPVP